MFLVFVAAAQAIEINPGDVRNVNCTENCVNGSLPVSCATCPQCNATECGVCSIDTELHWNETYNNTEGPCDIEIFCEPMNLSQMGKINFPSRIKIKKDSGNFQLSIDVYDQRDQILESWNKQISQEDIVEFTYEFNYSCPADLTTDVNIETCSPFLETVFNTTNPMVFQLVTGQSACMQRLVECQSKMEARSDVAHIWEQRYSLILDQYSDVEELYNDCFLQMDYNNRNSTLYKAVATTRAEKAGWVEPHWFWLVIFMGIGYVFILMYEIFSGGAE